MERENAVAQTQERVFDHDQLGEYASEIKRQAESKRDFLVNSLSKMVDLDSSDGLNIALTNGDTEHFDLTRHAHQQVAAKWAIPWQYYQRMLEEAPRLLSTNILHWMRATPKDIMIRTLDGHVRAVMSNRYRPLDNIDIANRLLPIIGERPDSRILTSALTEKRMYLKVAFDNMTVPVITNRGQHNQMHRTVGGGLLISNSEVGAGTLKIEGYLQDQICDNGLVVFVGVSKHHVGRAQDTGGGDLEALLSDDTKAKRDEAFWGTCADVVRATIQDDRFSAAVTRLQNAADQPIESPKLEKVVEVGLDTAKIQTSQGERENVLQHLIKGGDLSQFGLMSAVTRAAQDTGSYDRQVELERDANRLVQLPSKAWNRVSKADQSRVDGAVNRTLDIVDH